MRVNERPGGAGTGPWVSRRVPRSGPRARYLRVSPTRTRPNSLKPLRSQGRPGPSPFRRSPTGLRALRAVARAPRRAPVGPRRVHGMTSLSAHLKARVTRVPPVTYMGGGSGARSGPRRRRGPHSRHRLEEMRQREKSRPAAPSRGVRGSGLVLSAGHGHHAQERSGSRPGSGLRGSDFRTPPRRDRPGRPGAWGPAYRAPGRPGRSRDEFNSPAITCVRPCRQESPLFRGGDRSVSATCPGG
ncbi:hypothetical protein EES45_25530 [Streptomyces sp. ADI97-07]|nr:hypothetical protein EES45_25530 [Streptomyces sp. ADI97-07]